MIVYLNNADPAALEGLGLDHAAVEAVINARPLNGWEDLGRAGLAQTTIASLKRQDVEIGEASSGPIGEPGSGGRGGSAAGNIGRA